MKPRSLLLMGLVLLLAACTSAEQKDADNTSTETEQTNTQVPVINTLSAAEKAEGWQLLFNGENFEGWTNYLQDTIGSGWIIDDSAIHLNAVRKEEGGWQAANGGDILFAAEFEDFELQLEWKIGECGNSGIIYYVKEDEQYGYPWMTGLEMQVLDNTCHPDAKIEKHRAGDLYDLIAVSEETVKPAGAWNQVRIKCVDGQLEHWLNGKQVVTTTLWNDDWKALVAGSKFKEWSGFGTYSKGKICLQDHGDPVWYRNIKARKL